MWVRYLFLFLFLSLVLGRSPLRRREFACSSAVFDCAHFRMATILLLPPRWLNLLPRLRGPFSLFYFWSHLERRTGALVCSLSNLLLFLRASMVSSKESRPTRDFSSPPPPLVPFSSFYLPVFERCSGLKSLFRPAGHVLEVMRPILFLLLSPQTTPAAVLFLCARFRCPSALVFYN